MAKLGRGGRARPKPVMNVTPLVDVVLVLLIIFMIVIPAMDAGLQLEEPKVENVDEEKDTEEPHLLSLTRDGRFLLEDREIAANDVGTALASAHARAPGRKLVLRADRGVRYEQIRDLFRTAQTVGFPGIALRVSHRQTDGEEG
jgi:biopolymer transport protein ExbD